MNKLRKPTVGFFTEMNNFTGLTQFPCAYVVHSPTASSFLSFYFIFYIPKDWLKLRETSRALSAFPALAAVQDPVCVTKSRKDALTPYRRFSHPELAIAVRRGSNKDVTVRVSRPHQMSH